MQDVNGPPGGEREAFPGRRVRRGAPARSHPNAKPQFFHLMSSVHHLSLDQSLAESD